MSRLIAFGCSNTYGHGLSDCFLPPDLSGPIPSKLAWPNHLANLMNIDTVVNNSRCGSSNKEIWDEILKFKFNQDDVVFILWSFIDRTCFFTDKYPDLCDGIIKILPGIESRYSKVYYKLFYSSVDQMLDFSLRVDHCARYLTSLNLKFYNLYVEGIENINLSTWNSTNFLNVNFFENQKHYPLALDNSHAGIEAHQSYAKSVFENLTVFKKE